MEQAIKQNDIYSAVKFIKGAIQQTRYRVMRSANKEALALYYSVGGYLVSSIEAAKWGDKVIESISEQLQQELPGLRGFSKTSIKKMRVFYTGWKDIFGSLVTNLPSSSMEGWHTDSYKFVSKDSEISPLSTDQFDVETLDAFLTVQFTHHYELLVRTSTLDERLFYIRRIAKEFWSVDKLKYNIGCYYRAANELPNEYSQALEGLEGLKELL